MAVMKILALETSTTSAAFAAVELDDNLEVVRVWPRVLDQARQLSRDAVLAVAGAIDDAGWALDDLDAIAVGIGPGSWTGLRIGMTTAKTISQTRDLPLLGIPTLDALALEASQIKVCDYCLYFAIAPCRAGEIYVKSWQTLDLNLALRSEEQIVTPQQLADEIARETPPWLAFVSTPGAGLKAVSEVTNLVSGFGTEVLEVAPETLVRNVARLALRRLKNGERDEPLAMQPLYLAPSNAERTLAEKIARQQLANQRP